MGAVVRAATAGAVAAAKQCVLCAAGARGAPTCSAATVAAWLVQRCSPASSATALDEPSSWLPQLPPSLLATHPSSVLMYFSRSWRTAAGRRFTAVTAAAAAPAASAAAACVAACADACAAAAAAAAAAGAGWCVYDGTGRAAAAGPAAAAAPGAPAAAAAAPAGCASSSASGRPAPLLERRRVSSASAAPSCGSSPASCLAYPTLQPCGGDGQVSVGAAAAAVAVAACGGAGGGLGWAAAREDSWALASLVRQQGSRAAGLGPHLTVLVFFFLAPAAAAAARPAG
jgi:hypothetical protein